MSTRQIIWSMILALMLLGGWYDRLTFGTFCLLVFVGMSLSGIFAAPLPVQKPTAEPAPETKIEEDIDPDEIIRVRRRAVEQIRNSLLRHHNSRGTDQAYQTSDAAKETTAIIQVLNGALAKKTRRISA